MAVLRIVANIKAKDLERGRAFYCDLLGMESLMDLGFIQTFGSGASMPVQLSVATEGGSGTEVPDLSIEVDDLDTVLADLENAGCPIEYGPVTEPWGVRRFYVRDPFGKLLNILQHH